jgi:hypothetical protein
MICKECMKEKWIDFYKHPLTKSWFMWRCIDCVLEWRKTEKELSLSRVRDSKRYKNPKRNLYSRWRWLMSRCYNPLDSHYKWYWERWIKVEWSCFIDFYNDMKDLYIEHTSKNWIDRKNCQIDRINNNWNYCKQNCRFVTAKENVRNSRSYKCL